MTWSACTLIEIRFGVCEEHVACTFIEIRFGVPNCDEHVEQSPCEHHGPLWSYYHNLLRIVCTGPGPSVPSTRDLTVCCLVRRGALWLLIRTEVLASGLLHAHHLVLHAHYAVHWRRQSLGFDELCLSQSGYLPSLHFMLWERFFSTRSSVSQIQTATSHGNFTDTSYSNKAYCSFTTTYKVSLDNPEWFATLLWDPQ